MKIVINDCHGGFGLSHDAIMRYAKIKDLNIILENKDSFCKNYYVNYVFNENYFSPESIPRNDPALIQVVEEMGEEAGDAFAMLKIVEIPDDVDWTIDDYDGREWVAERHRTWF